MSDSLEKWLFDPTVGRLVAAVLVVAVVSTLSQLLQRAVTRRVEDAPTRYRARKLVTFVGYVLMLLGVLTVFSDRLAGLTVAFGVAGAGIAFALQEVIASVAGWVAISFGNFYTTGDRVQLGGIKGDVIDIGVLRTTLLEVGDWVKGDLYNGRIVRVANSFIFKEPVYNYSADFPFLWDEITVPVRYGSDWEYARETLGRGVDEICRDYATQSREAWNKAVLKYQLQEARIEPQITLAATDNWIEFTARYVVDYRRRRFVRDRLFTRILEEIDRSENRIRLASATFELVGLPRLDVEYAPGGAKVHSAYVP
ncbi:MAG: transporter [Candidatus Eisenbacteria bacterium RBG_16_71_46]|nr:MAG: transporter [Candidatus Eisenbacteria bacterium RBG_16_71_46]